MFDNLMYQLNFFGVVYCYVCYFGMWCCLCLINVQKYGCFSDQEIFLGDLVCCQEFENWSVFECWFESLLYVCYDVLFNEVWKVVVKLCVVFDCDCGCVVIFFFGSCQQNFM